MDLNFDVLYNGELKRQFLEEITNNDDSRKPFYYLFIKTAELENKWNKDLFDMVSEELEGVYHTLKARTVTSAANYINNIYKYIEWAMQNGYTSSNLKDFELNIRGGYAQQFVSKNLSTYYTREELFDYLSAMDYIGDQAIILCIFEGIRGQRNSEIANMKAEHLKEVDGKYYIDLYDTEKNQTRENFEISYELYKMLLSLASLESYTDNRGVETYLEETPYIFRRSKVGRKPVSDRITNSYFMNKTIYFKNVFENNKFQLRDVEESGMMYYIDKWLNEKGDRKITNELLERLADKYNVGIYTHSISKKKTYSYSKIREKINHKFFTENYGEYEV